MKIIQLNQDVKEPSVNEPGESEIIEGVIYIKLEDIRILEECQNYLTLAPNWATKKWFEYRKENNIDTTYHITVVFNGCYTRIKHCILTNEQVEQIKQHLNED